MSYHCSECDVDWWSYQTDLGHCPVCGGGTVRRQQPASHDADTLYRIARDEAAKRDAYARFERYYAKRETFLDELALSLERSQPAGAVWSTRQAKR